MTVLQMLNELNINPDKKYKRGSNVTYYRKDEDLMKDTIGADTEVIYCGIFSEPRLKPIEDYTEDKSKCILTVDLKFSKTEYDVLLERLYKDIKEKGLIHDC